MRLLVAVLAVVAALAAVDQLFLWMERRGWIYWRRRKPDPRGAVLGPIDNVFNPAHEQVVEQQGTEEVQTRPRDAAVQRSDPGRQHQRTPLRWRSP